LKSGIRIILIDFRLLCFVIGNILVFKKAVLVSSIWRNV